MDESLHNKDEYQEKPIAHDDKDPAEESIPVFEPTDFEPDQDTQKMEVHKHPHHVSHKKKWNEYLLEFFMIFLAVFLGFLAETEREHIVEKDREKQFMSSLVRDLELDTTEISKGNAFRLQKIRSVDTALKLLVVQNGSTGPSQLYRLSVNYYGNRNFFQNSGTLDQLKNSGGLRLIGNRQIVDSIESYDQQIKRMSKRDDFEVEAFVFNNRIGQKLFDSWSVAKTFGFSDKPVIVQDGNSTIQLKTEYINEYINNLMNYEYLMKNNYAVFELNKQKALRLLEFIKRGYHL